MQLCPDQGAVIHLVLHHDAPKIDTLGVARPPITCYRHVSRALLLMAAQGKSPAEDTFDIPSAHNGFSGMRLCGLGVKVQ